MAISQDIKYALGLVKAGKDPTFWLDRASGYAFELVGAAAAPPATTTTSAVPVTTTAAPTMTQYTAAELDAGFVFQASLGNTTGADTNPAPGAAKEFGFSGVAADSATSKYGVFRDGALTETLDAPPAAGWDFAFGLAAGFNNDDPYTGPGAVRP
jgi:hypothetical protein